MNRRAFLLQSARVAAAACFTSYGLAGCGGGAGRGGTKALGLAAYLRGEEVVRERILEWEARRLQIVARRMGSNLPAAMVGELVALTLRPAESTTNIAHEREVLADAKIRAGDEAMRQLVADDVAITTAATELSVAAPVGWVVSEIDLISTRGTAEGFVDWFTDMVTLDDQRAMLKACPDHFLMHPARPDGVDVIEITGGATQASHFVIGLNKSGGLPIVVDPDFPVHLSGAAVNEYGTTIGGMNHRFRTLAEGFQSRLAIIFPASLPPSMISEHRWHLACEFSNWITAYIDETGD